MSALILLALLLHGVVASAGASAPMRFDHLSIEQGLSQNAVLAIHQDSRGFLWFGTENGLNRYDGHQFRQFRRESGKPGSLINDFIWNIVEDASGNLWIGTDGGGLAKWDPVTERFTTLRHDPLDPASLAGNRIRALHIDQQGLLWIGTMGGAVDRLDTRDGSLSHFRAAPDASESNGIFAILSDSRQQVWIGTDTGLDRFNPDTASFEEFRADQDNPTSLSGNRVRAIEESHDGAIWIGTYKNGLSRFDPQQGAFTQFRHNDEDAASLSHNRVRSIFQDRDGRLWIGTARSLDLFDQQSGGFHHYRNDPADPGSIADNYVLSLHQDRGGVLWVGTRMAGISKWNPRSWALGHHKSIANDPSTISMSNVSSFAEDDEGTVWVGTFGGGLNALNRENGKVRQYRKQSDAATSLSDDRIMALLYTTEKKLWIGTMTGGINILDPLTDEITVLRHDADDPTSLAADGIMALYEDSRGAIWVGTFGGGVSRFDSAFGTFGHYRHDAADPQSLASPRATAFAEDRHGAMWIGTDGGGLALLEPGSGRLHPFRNDPDDATSLSSDTVYSLHVDPAGTLWVGTRHGLNRIIGSSRQPDNVRFDTLTHTDGLSNDVAYGVVSDRNGMLWISTNHGLSRYDQSTRIFTAFHRSHGLQGEEFNFGAYFASATGELYFGGSNGFNAFLPERLQINPVPPPVVLTGISKLNKRLPLDHNAFENKRLNIGYNDDMITFEFAALDFTAPGENRYAYMLEGFDDEWVQLDNQHRITYTNLDKGEYTLRIRGANSDGVWNDAGITMQLHVQSAPWETWWAYASYVLAGLSLLGLVWRAEHRKVARKEQYSARLAEEVRARTRELAERNQQLHDANDQLQEASYTDPLTSLRNRRYFFEAVTMEVALIRRQYYGVLEDPEATAGEIFDLVFMMVDLDHFKPVNDTYGHGAGDEMLLAVRDVLNRSARDSDFVIRWGGDEFLIVGRHTNAAEASRIAERIRSEIAALQLELPGGATAAISCSIGFACFPFISHDPHVVSWEQALHVADAALYEAKKARGAWVGFLSTPASEQVEDLYMQVRENPQQLHAKGQLQIVSSIENYAQHCA